MGGWGEGDGGGVGYGEMGGGGCEDFNLQMADVSPAHSTRQNTRGQLLHTHLTQRSQYVRCVLNQLCNITHKLA